jgi:taurine dioxygenase
VIYISSHLHLEYSIQAIVLNMRNGHQQVAMERVAGSLGAEVSNVDLRSTDDSTVQQIRDAFLEHKVIFFRDQNLTPQEFLDFASKLGQPVEYPFVKGIDGFPEIIEVLKQEHETTNFGGVWHADTTYLEEPPKGTILLSRQVPPYGGDTLFANQAAAYEALSDGLKKTLSQLRGISNSAKADASKTREDRVKDSGLKVEDMVVSHPAVRTHPETGKKSLYVNIAHTSQFEGWTEAESKPLLEYLFQHQVRPEFTCRFRWKANSIAFWDNRTVLHNPINDYHGFRRSMHRITLAGDKPF